MDPAPDLQGVQELKGLITHGTKQLNQSINEAGTARLLPGWRRTRPSGPEGPERPR